MLDRACQVLEVGSYVDHRLGNTTEPKKDDRRWPINPKKQSIMPVTDVNGNPLGERVRIQPMIVLRKKMEA